MVRGSFPSGHALGAAVLVLIAVGCGGGPAGSQAPASATPQPQRTAGGTATVAPTIAARAGSGVADACALLTLAEVSAAVDDTIDKAVPSADERYAYCEYQVSGDRRVRVFVTKSRETATSVFGTMKINKGEAVSGVGDEAFWSTDSFQPGLYVMKGGTLAFISGSSSGPEDPIIALGALLVSRL